MIRSRIVSTQGEVEDQRTNARIGIEGESSYFRVVIVGPHARSGDNTEAAEGENEQQKVANQGMTMSAIYPHQRGIN